MHSRLEMKQVERFPDRSVLRFYVTDLGTESERIEFPASATDQNIDFRLVDPVGRKAYMPLMNADDESVGSDPASRTVYRGVRSVTFDAGVFGRIPGVPVR